MPHLTHLKVSDIMCKAIHRSENNIACASEAFPPLSIYFHLVLWASNTFKKITPHCLWSVDVFIPGYPRCPAAAVVWPSVCVVFLGHGRRARSSCCLRRDAAAGSSAPQQIPYAPGRHGKNWSWMPLREEKGRRGENRKAHRKRQADGHF